MTWLVFCAAVVAASVGAAGWAVAGEMRRPADDYPGCLHCDRSDQFTCDCEGPCGWRGCPAARVTGGLLGELDVLADDDAFSAALAALHAELDAAEGDDRD